jgi:hypothetical protein
MFVYAAVPGAIAWVEHLNRVVHCLDEISVAAALGFVIMPDAEK